MKELHARLAEKPEQTNLDELWKQLGVVYRAGKVNLDDDAPLAAIRKSMTCPSPMTSGRRAGMRRHFPASLDSSSTIGRTDGGILYTGDWTSGTPLPLPPGEGRGEGASGVEIARNQSLGLLSAV